VKCLSGFTLGFASAVAGDIFLGRMECPILPEDFSTESAKKETKRGSSNSAEIGSRGLSIVPRVVRGSGSPAIATRGA
jgi:hypothetical protein